MSLLLLLQGKQRVIEKVVEGVVKKLAYWHVLEGSLALDVVKHVLEHRVRLTAIQNIPVFLVLVGFFLLHLRVVADLLLELFMHGLLFRVLASVSVGGDFDSLQLREALQRSSEGKSARVGPIFLVVSCFLNRNFF